MLTPSKIDLTTQATTNLNGLLKGNGSLLGVATSVDIPGLTPQVTSATGAQNNFNLSGHLTYLTCSGAAPVFSGFTVLAAAPTDGDMVIIDNIGSGTVKVTTQDTNSTAANRIICPSTNGQVIGVSGRMMCIYDGANSRWRERVIECGAPIPVTFAAGNFTGQGAMTWTLDASDQHTFTYQQVGTVLYVEINLGVTTVGGTADAGLNVAIPGGFTSVTQIDRIARINDNGVQRVAYSRVEASGSVISLYRLDSGNITLSTNNTAAAIPMMFQVN